jgi:hypothetical protein
MIKPGKTCEGCGRKMPYPKKESSPETVVISYRVPVDEAEAHKEVLETVAKFLGTAERPHERFWTVTFALAAVLQDESLRGAGQRSVLA